MQRDLDLTISGESAGEEFTVERLSGREALGKPFEYQVTLISLSPSIELAKFVGDTLTVTLATNAEGGQRHFHGHITSMALVDTFDRHARYRLTLRPWFWLLSTRSNSRIFQNKSIPDIAEALFGEHGFTDFRKDLSGSYPAREYVVQYRESDFAFVSRLLEQVGIYYHFEHAAGLHTMVLADSEMGHPTAPGYEEVPFYPPVEGALRERDHLSIWQMVQQLRPGAYASDDFDFEKPTSDLLTKLKAESRHKHGDKEVYDYPGGFTQHSDGENSVRARLDGLRTDVETVTAGGDAHGLGAGVVFTLANHPLDAQNKKYLIVAASFDAVTNAAESGRDDAGLDFNVSLTAIDSHVPYRPTQTTRVPRVEGPQTAIVVGQGGEEIWTDKYGRVKVQFHWDREGGSDEKSSCWVRVSQAWAGNQWGSMHIPRIGQEVIVDFLEGDPDRPIITGRVYNGTNMPPYALPGNQTQSGIKSRSTKGGSPSNFNELRFEDKKGSEHVFMQAEKDLLILVKNDERRQVGHDRVKEVTNDETTSIGGNRTETVTKDESITIDGSRDETVAKTETVTIGIARNHTIGAEESVAVGGTRSLTVGASDSTSVGGSQSVSVGASQSVDVGANQSITVGGGRTLTVTKDDSVTVNGKRTESIAKEATLSVGKKLLIDAADEITIKSGEASIILKKNGDITIKGKNITLQGSGKVNVKADGDVIIKGSKISQN
ncbi:MAG: type VI secretion system tip protein TssI/VgrG [Variovorax sp.]